MMPSGKVIRGHGETQDHFNSFFSIEDMEKFVMCLTLTLNSLVVAKQGTEFRMVLGWGTWR